ncbi:chloride channel protein [Pseudobacteriovorax antillogorgiicola]|nr:chloride channel protein [Pseudobacteriovorax antillogorgiicola]
MNYLTSFFNKKGKEFGLRYLILGGIIGCAAGLAAVVFHYAILEASEYLILPWLAAIEAEGLTARNIGFTIMIPTVCGILVAYITERFAPEAEGHGVPEIMNAVVSHDGVIKPKVGLVKFLCSTLSIGGGFSVGREGPTALIGATLGSCFGQVLRFNRKRMKLAVGCGTAAGIAATFNAPLAGTAFALELVVGNLSLVYLSPIIFSAMIATVITRSIAGNNHALFSEFKFILQSPSEILLYCFLGAIVGLVGLAYTRTLYFLEDKASKLPFPRCLKGAMGGSIMGVTLLFIPEVAGPNTWPVIQSFVKITPSDFDRIMWLGLILVAFKILFTSLSLSLGASGGVFAPSLVIGGAVGGPFGILVNRLWPGLADHPGGYALVAMGAIVAATTQAPMTAIFMIFELTNDYEIVLPLIMACGFSMAVHNHLQKGSIYTLKLLRKGINLQWGRDIGVLQSILVNEAMKRESDAIDVDASYSDIVSTMRNIPRRTLPVVDRKNTLLGVISSASLMHQDHDAKGITARDLMDPDAEVVTPDQSLYVAFETITDGDYSYLPVVESRENPRLLGGLYRQELLQLYQNQLNLRGIY